MNTKQNKETLRYFSDNAKKWLDFSYGRTSKVNVSRQRIQTVLDLASSMPNRSGFLDLGCGGGQLCIALAKYGFENIYGVDFSAEMIENCVQISGEQGVDIEFICGSIFDDALWSRSYGAIAALGLIEYLSFEEMCLLFEKAAKTLCTGGNLYVGSRNRLFNIFSMNEYTLQEREIGAMERLQDECLIFSKYAAEELNTNLLTLGNVPKFGEIHPQAGSIEVTTRHQYTPAELIRILSDIGLKIHGVHGVHYHPFPGNPAAPALADAHKSISDLVFDVGRTDPLLIPLSSSFILHVSK